MKSARTTITFEAASGCGVNVWAPGRWRHIRSGPCPAHLRRSEVQPRVRGIRKPEGLVLVSIRPVRRQITAFACEKERAALQQHNRHFVALRVPADQNNFGCDSRRGCPNTSKYLTGCGESGGKKNATVGEKRDSCIMTPLFKSVSRRQQVSRYPR